VSQILPAYPPGGPRFDVGAVVVLGLFITGAYVDGWAHNHYGNQIESFFTTWHAILYGGFLLTALYVVVAGVRNRRSGYDWRHCLPKGYGVTLLGVATFALFGFIDMIWHILYGFENSIDAFLSPPHVGLFFGSLLMFCGPIRAKLARRETRPPSWRTDGTFVLALVWLFAELTFILQGWLIVSATDASRVFAPAGPYWSQNVRDLDSRSNVGQADIGGLHADAAGVEAANRVEQPTNFERLLERSGTAIAIVSAVLVAGFLLFAIKSQRIPAGAFTLILFLDVLGMSLMKELQIAPNFMLPQIGLGLAWGVVTDLLYAIFKPTTTASSALYAFMFFAPACAFGLYFLAIASFGGGIWWKIAMPIGCTIYAGCIGVLLASVASRWESV
jgi:hypothetical protein